MCVPFGKILRGNAIPNTVTKTIHTDKVFARDLTSFDIENFPGYAPLESQIRTIHSFRRPVILVDDLLHSGNRIRALDPLFRQEGVVIDRVLVGLLSGRGRDLMAAKGRSVDSVYFIPNMRSWFVESTMYPFIGGDTVGHGEPSVPGLTPAVNLILPYAFPRFYRECGREAVFRFSCACLENARDILLALETTFRERYARNLTLSRLSEAVILPLSPDKGSCMHYDPSLPASVFLQNDLEMLLRMRNVLQPDPAPGAPSRRKEPLCTTTATGRSSSPLCCRTSPWSRRSVPPRGRPASSSSTGTRFAAGPPSASPTPGSSLRRRRM